MRTHTRIVRFYLDTPTRKSIAEAAAEYSIPQQRVAAVFAAFAAALYDRRDETLQGLLGAARNDWTDEVQSKCVKARHARRKTV